MIFSENPPTLYELRRTYAERPAEALAKAGRFPLFGIML